MTLLEEEYKLMDEVAKELFVRRMHSIRDMCGPEIEEIAKECFEKSIHFMKGRQAAHEKFRLP
jgi:hypothetical protein